MAADGAARLHRIDDHAVVDEVEPRDVGSRREGRLGGGLVARAPVVDDVVRGVVPDQRHIGARGPRGVGYDRQRVVIDGDEFGRIARGVQCFRDDQRDRITHVAHALALQQGIGWHRALAAVAVRHGGDTGDVA